MKPPVLPLLPLVFLLAQNEIPHSVSMNLLSSIYHRTLPSAHQRSVALRRRGDVAHLDVHAPGDGPPRYLRGTINLVAALERSGVSVVRSPRLSSITRKGNRLLQDGCREDSYAVYVEETSGILWWIARVLPPESAASFRSGTHMQHEVPNGIHRVAPSRWRGVE